MITEEGLPQYEIAVKEMTYEELALSLKDITAMISSIHRDQTAKGEALETPKWVWAHYSLAYNEMRARERSAKTP